MVRRILIAVAGLVVLVVAVAGAGLGCAHRQIRSLEPRLPESAAVLAIGAEHPEAGPIRIHYIETASQRMPRSGVLEAGLDPSPDAAYEMTHAAILLRWADGRHFLIDAGMDEETALEFGGPLELLGGADPIEFHSPISRALGRAARSVKGIAFTHLHHDHTDGLVGLCEAGVQLALFQTRAQAELSNYTTRDGAARLEEATCAAPVYVDGVGFSGIPGFGGLFVAHVAGHTPGSQVFVVRMADSVGGQRVVLAGDVANAYDGIRHNLPKPRLYSLLMVPESPVQLERVRLRLREVDADPAATVVVAHDRLALQRSGIPAWP